MPSMALLADSMVSNPTNANPLLLPVVYMGVSARVKWCVLVCACLYVNVCVCVKERARETEGAREHMRGSIYVYH